MNTAVTPAGDPSPVESFSHCHAGIRSGLREFATLPQLQEAVQRARDIAWQTLALFDHAVQEHHAEEEKELFSAVLRSAKPGAERERVQDLVQQLTNEHREIEALWRRLRPEVSNVAAGKAGRLGEETVKLLVDVYGMHADLEEREFLPLAREILGRNGDHMAALGMSLHMRRHPAFPIGHV